MTAEELYDAIGGSYSEIMGRFLTEDRVLRFVKKFPADGSFQLLKDSLASGACEDAFRAAHTLKGVAQNLAFTALYEQIAPITEVLRAGSLNVGDRMPELERVYNLTVESISKL